MRKKRVIKLTSMPAKSPVGLAVMYYLLLEHIQAPSWAYGVLWTCVALAAAVFIASFWTEERSDVPGFGGK